MDDEEEEGHPGSIERGPRRSLAGEAQRSVLTVIGAKTGDAPRVSLRDDDSASLGSPPIDPSSTERLSIPDGRSAYSILGEIARGGMGVVLRGHDMDLGRDVALKVLAKELADRPEVVQRFVEEAQIGGQLQHPGIVPVYELGLMADERPYFTMKLVKGRTLAMLLAERPTPASDRRRMIDLFLSVCQTLAYAHSRGVIHRDLKPANIMVGAFGEVQVVDWGLAKVLARGGKADEERAREERGERTLLETVRSPASKRPGSSTGTDSLVGQVLGTPSYMPPEQATGMVDRLDERSDVFALGAILCEILTGAPPYASKDDDTILQAAQAVLEPAFERLDACDADPELVKIARHCLVAAKTARPRNAGVVAEKVRAHLESVEERAHSAELEAVEARVHATAERRARRLTLALAASVLGLLLLAGGGWAYRQRTEREETARIERSLDELYLRVQGLLAEGRIEEAVHAVSGATVLVEGRAPEDPLASRAHALLAQVAAQAARAREEREQIERDDALLAALEEVRLEAADASGADRNAATDRAFGEAFRAWGLDVDLDLERSLQTLRASRIADELAPALDDWATVRRVAHGWRSFEADAMSSLAADLDPDPTRLFLREALMERDAESLRRMALDPATLELEASTLLVLGKALRDLRFALGDISFATLALALFSDATGLYPGDLRLRVSAALVANDLELWEIGLRHASAAAAIEPGSRALAIAEARLLNRLDRHPAALRSVDRVLASNPDDQQARALAGISHFTLGEYERAFGYLESFAGVAAGETGTRIVLEGCRYLTGRIDVRTLDQRLVAIGGPSARLMSAHMMLLLPEEERDLALVARILAEAPKVQAVPEIEWVRLLIEGLLALLEDRPEDALRISKELARLRGLSPLQLAQADLMEVEALAQLGRLDEAKALTAKVNRYLTPILADSLERWRSSGLQRQIDAVNALLLK